MTDLVSSAGGVPHQRSVIYRDSGGGYLSEEVSAELRVWNTSTLTWDKWDGTIKTGDIEIGQVKILGADGSTLAVVNGGALNVGGNVASGVADSGNPVKVGGRYNSAGITLLDGQRGDLQLNPKGEIAVSFGGGNQGSDGAGNPVTVQDGLGVARNLATDPFLFNETGWDRQRGNTTAALIAAGTTNTQSNKAITNYNDRFLDIVLNITAATSTPTATVAISGTTASGYPFPILTGAAIVSTGTTVYRVGPGLTALTNLTANDLVPRNILVTVTVTGSVTYGVDYVLSV